MRKYSIQVIAAWIVLGMVWCRAADAPQVGEQARELGLEKLLQAPTGAEASWEKLRGKVVVLEFWATWCAPCIAAIPHLNELADTFQDKPVQFIAITDENEQIIEPFLKKKAMRAWIGLDTDKSMFKAYAVSGIPHTVIVDTNGAIAGITHPVGLKAEHIQNLLAGKPIGMTVRAAGDQVKPRSGPNDSGKSPIFQVLIRPSEEDSARMSAGPSGKTDFGPIFSHSMYAHTVTEMLSTAFRVSSARITTNAPLPEGQFDFLVTAPQPASDRVPDLLQQALRTTFGLVSRREERDVKVYVLTMREAGHKGLPTTVSTGGSSSSSGPGRITAVNGSANGIARSLESLLKVPVFNETGLKERYDYELKWDQKNGDPINPEALTTALREQLGLELSPSQRKVEFLVLETEQKTTAKTEPAAKPH